MKVVAITEDLLRGLRRGNSLMTLLEVNNIHAYYGNIHALKGLSIT